MWTKVPKPTGSNWTRETGFARIYDDPSVLYDDPDVFYDGFDTTAWTNVPKPAGAGTVTILPGYATGILGPPTYSVTINIQASPWTKVPKPTD